MNYSGDGLLWRATKRRCKKLDPYHRKLKDRKKSCKKKGYPIKLKYPDENISFTVTDEKLEQMQEDGRLDQLHSQGVQVHGGADPLYFEWRNQVAKYEKNLPTRTLDTYKATFPYLDLNALNSIGWLFSGQNFARQHEAALLWISKSQDKDLLKRVKDFYDRILLNLKKSSDSQKVAKAIIDLTWEAASEKTGVLSSILGTPKKQIESTAKNVKKMIEKEKEAINKRLKPIQPFNMKKLSISTVPGSDIVASNIITEVSNQENNQKTMKIVVGSLVGISAIFLIYSLVSE